MAKIKRNRRLAHVEYMRKWRKTHREFVAFYNHLDSAKRRGVTFLMTFAEWWSIWQTSGKWEQRGRHKGQYVMARFRDAGPYAVGNVRICTGAENQAEQGANLSAESRARISAACKARPPISEETRRKLSEATKIYMIRNPAAKARASTARWARHEPEG
jgi:hypothetical protein